MQFLSPWSAAVSCALVLSPHPQVHQLWRCPQRGRTWLSSSKMMLNVVIMPAPLSAMHNPDKQWRGVSQSAHCQVGIRCNKDTISGYTQCSYSKGNSVQSLPPEYANYAWLYPGLYGYPWFDWGGPGFLSANVFVFHRSHFHHGHY